MLSLALIHLRMVIRIVVYRNSYLEKTEATTGSVWSYFHHILVVKLLNMMDQVSPPQEKNSFLDQSYDA